MAGTALKIAQALGHRLDALLASAIGLLTLISWHLHDASPLATLDRGTSAVGLDISEPLTTAGTWLHDEVHRSWLVPVSLVILGGALAHQMWRLARNHSELAAAIRAEDPEALRRHHRFVGACEVRFWSIAWVVTGLLDFAVTPDPEDPRGRVLRVLRRRSTQQLQLPSTTAA